MKQKTFFFEIAPHNWVVIFNRQTKQLTLEGVFQAKTKLSKIFQILKNLSPNITMRLNLLNLIMNGRRLTRTTLKLGVINLSILFQNGKNQVRHILKIISISTLILEWLLVQGRMKQQDFA